MQTHFSPEQLADPATAEAANILRKCVHCGFCTATCPTYALLGDERDSPRGRIYLIKDMLENDRPADATVVRHVDRCLSCLACMTTCPSGVNYMHLVDHARTHIARTYRRPLKDRWLRRLLSVVLPYPRRFRVALLAARAMRPFRSVLSSPLRKMVDLAPTSSLPPVPSPAGAVYPAVGVRQQRVALLTGCVQSVLGPHVNAATIRLLNRHGCEVVTLADAGCCGALRLHLADGGRDQAKANIRAFMREARSDGLDAIVINTSGCGVVMKDYGHLFQEDPDMAADAGAVSALARDLSEIMADIGLTAARAPVPMRVAYHSACSLQHGQKIRSAPTKLLREAGFEVVDVPEGHLCCGSAGVYNILQPDIAGALRTRKLANILKTRPDVVAAGNIGCMIQIGGADAPPVVHTAELLDWATGGPMPEALASCWKIAGGPSPEFQGFLRPGDQ